MDTESDKKVKILKYYKDKGQKAKQEKEYYCKVCDKALRTQQALDRHNKGKKHIKLINNVVDEYPCELCTKVFFNKKTFWRHNQGKCHKFLFMCKEQKIGKFRNS